MRYRIKFCCRKLQLLEGEVVHVWAGKSSKDNEVILNELGTIKYCPYCGKEIKLMKVKE